MVDNSRVLLIHHRKLDKWIPPGGHIEADETPDEALVREMKEELGLDVRILNYSDIPLEGNVKRHLALPFYVNVHSVGDHDHCCFFYVCEALNLREIDGNKRELKEFAWFTEEELYADRIPLDVRHQAIRALRFKKSRKND